MPIRPRGPAFIFVRDLRTGEVTQLPYRNVTQLQAWSPGGRNRAIIVLAVIIYLLVVVKSF